MEIIWLNIDATKSGIEKKSPSRPMRQHFDVGRIWEKGKGSKYRKDVCLGIASSSLVEKGTSYIVKKKNRKKTQKKQRVVFTEAS